MKYIWLIEDYSASQDGEFECYGFCYSKEKAEQKAAQLNLESYNYVKARYEKWVSEGSIVANGSRPAKPEWTDYYEVAKLKLIEG
jgi:hypothetical protein